MQAVGLCRKGSTLVVIEWVLGKLTEVLVVEQDHLQGIEYATHHMAVNQDHVNDLGNDRDLVEPVVFAGDVEQHLLEIHCVVYSDGDCQAQKRGNLLVGQRVREQYKQPDDKINNPYRFAPVLCDIGSIQGVSEEEDEENGSVWPGGARHELLEGDLDDHIEEDEVIDQEQEEAPNCLIDAPQPFLAVYEPNHYKQYSTAGSFDPRTNNKNCWIDNLPQLMEDNNWRVDKEEAEKVLAREIEVSKVIELRMKDAVECVGNAHRYQIILIVYLVLCFILSTYLLVGTSYFFMNPTFFCDGEEKTEKEACKMPPEECTLQNDYTITTYVGLYCDRMVERETIQAMLGIGACLGVLFINFVSDYKGRRFSFLCSLTAGFFAVLLMIIGAYTKTIWLFFCSQVLAAFCGNSIFPLVYVMSDRLMSKRYSNYCILITNGFFALTEASLALFTGLMDWQQLLIGFMFVPSILLIIACRFIIIEDPAFLFTKSRFQECKESLQAISKFNRTEEKLEECYGILDNLIKNHVQIEAVVKGEKETGPTSKLKYLHLLLKKEVLLPIIMIGLFNFAGNLNYYAFNYAISGIGFSFETEIVLFGLVEFVGIFPMMFFGEKTPRKSGLMVVILIEIALSWVFIFNLSSTTETVLVVLVRFMLVNQYMIYIYLVVETFPQHIQATSFGIIEFIGQMGKLVAPFTITVSNAFSVSPIFLTAVVSVVFQIFTLLPLRETLSKGKSEKDEEKEAEQSLLQGGSVNGGQFE